MNPRTPKSNRLRTDSIIYISTVLICLAQVALVGLKIAGVIDWPWLYIAFPLVALFTALVIIGSVFSAVAVIVMILFER